MTTNRILFSLLVGAVLWSSPASPAAAQDSVRVMIRNASNGPLYISVYDEVCRATVFSGQINSRAQRPVTLCPDRRSRARIRVFDRFGEQRGYRVRQGQVLSLRARYGSGGLGR